LLSTAYTRIRDSGWHGFLLNTIVYSLPLDAFPLKYLGLEGKGRVSIQMGALSSAEVAELLRTNPDQFPNCYEGKIFENRNEKADYVVIRYKNAYYLSKWGDIKYYYSCFSCPITQFISMPGRMNEYYNVILPYPTFLEENSDKSCTFTMKWKSIWGHP
jgi:hypothetical protein